MEQEAEAPICVVGAGALGRAFGVPLAAHAEVSFLVRPDKLDAHESWFVNLGRGELTARRRTLCLAQPQRVTEPPAGSTVLLAVRVEQLDDALPPGFGQDGVYGCTCRSRRGSGQPGAWGMLLVVGLLGRRRA